MNEFACETILLDVNAPENTEIMFLTSSSGTFMLRRANYFINTGKLLLNSDHARELSRLVHGDDLATKQRMIAHYLRKVVNIAKRYSNHGLVLLDLIREGTAGLIQAMEKFEREGGFRFSSYAAHCIRRNIERAIANRNDTLADLLTAPSPRP